MRKLLLIAMVAVAYACNSQTNKSINFDEEILRAINHQFIQNFLNNDTVEHSKIIHHNFLFIGTDGSIHDRNEYLRGWTHGYDIKVMPEFDLEEVQIRVFGDFALVVAKTKDKTMKDGKWKIGETRYTDTYVKEYEQWKCVQVQLTRMPSNEKPD